MKKSLLIIISVLLAVTFLNGVPRDKVVVEIATGTWCQYCPGAAMGADALVANGHDVAIIENHNGDSFANAGSNSRNSYYGVTGYPTAFFDGGNAYVGGSATSSLYSPYLSRVNARLAVPSHFTISSVGQEANGTYSVNVYLEKVETDTNTNLVLQATVTESEIQYNWQGQTHLNFVNRLMVPNQSGTSVNFGAGTFLTIPLSFTMNPSWVLTNCEFVVFLQNNTTKEILQATKYSFTQLFGENPVSVSGLDFPDTFISLTDTLPLTLTNPGSTTMTGTITCDNPAFTITLAERLDYAIAPYDSQTFDISFTPTTDLTETGNLIITTNLVLYPYISVSVTGTGAYAPPKAPENMDVVMNGSSAYITWNPVTETVINTPIITDWYLFYCNSSGSLDGVFTYLGRTHFEHYTHNNAAYNASPKFYRVEAQKLDSRNGFDPTDLLKPGMSEEEVNAILKSK